MAKRVTAAWDSWLSCRVDSPSPIDLARVATCVEAVWRAVVAESLVTWSAGDEAAARRRLVALAERHGVDAHLDERDESRDDLYEERSR